MLEFVVFDVLLQHGVVEVRPLLLDFGSCPVLGRVLDLQGVVVEVVVARQVAVDPLRLLQRVSPQPVEARRPLVPGSRSVLP